jgi:hypothetical protein
MRRGTGKVLLVRVHGHTSKIQYLLLRKFHWTQYSFIADSNIVLKRYTLNMQGFTEARTKYFQNNCTSYLGLHYGRAVAQAVSRRLPAVTVWIRAKVMPYGIYGVQSGTGRGFLEVLRFPCHSFHPLLYNHLLSGDGTLGQIVAAITSGLSLTPAQHKQKTRFVLHVMCQVSVRYIIQNKKLWAELIKRTFLLHKFTTTTIILRLNFRQNRGIHDRHSNPEHGWIFNVGHQCQMHLKSVRQLWNVDGQKQFPNFSSFYYLRPLSKGKSSLH